MKSVGFLPSHASLISFPSCGDTGWVVLLVAVFVALSPPFSQKKDFQISLKALTVELRGLPPYVGIPPFFRCVVTSGTNSGTLRGFFLASFQSI